MGLFDKSLMLIGWYFNIFISDVFSSTLDELVLTASIYSLINLDKYPFYLSII